MVALGGNALLQADDTPSVEAQLRNMRAAAASIARLCKEYRVVLTHGNGPQVGNLLIRSERGVPEAYPVPLHAAVAQSQGEIGYIIQQVLRQELGRPVASLVTQVVVDPDDPAFQAPTKPVGPRVDEATARRWEAEGHQVVAVDGGFRRVVPSPRPQRIVEADALRALVRGGILTIAGGGGGVPVVHDAHGLRGVDAVIDKDLLSAVLAREVDADALFILTDVPYVYLAYGSGRERPVKSMTVAEGRHAIDEGLFPKGSMGPKVEAGIRFLEQNPGGRVVIGALERAPVGTRLVP